MKILEVMEGDVIRTRFATKQAQRGLDKYRPVPGLKIPVFDRARGGSLPPDLAQDPEPFARFYAQPTGRGNATHIMGVRENGREYITSTTNSEELAAALADAYNRGGFSAHDIQPVRLREMAEGFRVYAARVKVKNPLYNNTVDVAVFAKNTAMARALLQAQFGADSVVTNVHELSA